PSTNLIIDAAVLINQHDSIDDLDTSIQLGRKAVSLCLEVHADRDTYLNNLASSLTSRFHHQGKPNDLNEAIPLHEEALTLHPPRHPCRDTTLNNLAVALDTRYRKSHVSEDLNEAIGLYREAIRLRRLDLPQRRVTLHNLSSVICSRFTQTQKNEDVEEDITLCQQSLSALSSLHPDRYFSYMMLQEAYLSRYRILHDPADLSLAVENFRLASGHATQGFPERINAALRWVNLPDASPSLFGPTLKLTEAMLKYVRRMPRALPHDQQSPQSPLRLSSSLYQTFTTHSCTTPCQYSISTFNLPFLTHAN
ncbi:hypothetical protein C8R48DRAFT_801690, partial [Suillus tomentosus]